MVTQNGSRIDSLSYSCKLRNVVLYVDFTKLNSLEMKGKVNTPRRKSAHLGGEGMERKAADHSSLALEKLTSAFCACFSAKHKRHSYFHGTHK